MVRQDPTGCVADVFGFRPSDEERALIDRVKRTHGMKSTAEAIRYLVRKGAAEEGGKRPAALLAYRVPKRFRDGRVTTVREIDDALYGGEP